MGPGHSHDHVSFFLAGIAVLTSRMKQAAHVKLAFSGKMLRLAVEAETPFMHVLLQVRDALDSSNMAAGDTACDAELHIGHEQSSASSGATLYMVRADDDKWNVSVAETGERAARALSALVCLLEDAATRPDAPTGRLRLIRDEDARALYAKLNRTRRTIRPGTVLELFAASTQSRGGKEAIVFAGCKLSYAQLDARSDAIARQLRQRGADQKRPVALCMERSESVPLLQLAALKAGSFYVPLDPAHPQQRLLDVIAECRPAVVIASEKSAVLFASADVAVCTLDDLEVHFDITDDTEAPSVLSTDLAYMIYTSGTTGRPKGVMVTHGSLVNLLLGAEGLIDETNRLLAVASFAFDISGLDMFLPLIRGATVVIAPDSAVGDPWQLMELMEQQDIDFLQATPVTWRMLLAAGFEGRPAMKMLSGGEALARDLAEALLRNGGELWNGYGPTETTIYSSMVRVHHGTGPVTIGPPMANTRFYVVDEAGQLLPPGFAGELLIGGSGVAAGYFDRPELNSTRFLSDPWATGEDEHAPIPDEAYTLPRLFRTGDLVRWLPGSEDAFEIFGRLDHQVKLRGYRIELGEIETVLRSREGIADAAVLLREDQPGEPWLVGYCAKKPGAGVNEAARMEAAEQRLPRYMLPSRLVMLDALPLTGSGKVDRLALAALPAPDRGPDRGTPANAEITEGPIDASDGLETSLLRIFREVLRSNTFGMDDNFFLHGGYSIQAVRLFSMINSTLHRRMPLTMLFDAPTVRRLAALIRSGDVPQTVVPIRTAGTKAPFFFVQSYLLYELSRDVVDRDRPIFGLREQGTAKTFLGLQEQVTLYVAAINKQFPEGPVHLGGWCAAAPLTIEIARTLAQQGRTPGMVALFDAEAPGFVERPARGSALLAKTAAMLRFHSTRLRSMPFRERLRYMMERIRQAPATLFGRFYERYMGQMVRLQKRLPWLPGSLFRNRFNAGDVVDVKRVQPIDLRIQLFRARDVPMIPGSDEALGWREIAQGGVEVTFIPGHHESMFLPPNVAALRDAFQASMRKIESRLLADRVPLGLAADQ